MGVKNFKLRKAKSRGRACQCRAGKATLGTREAGRGGCGNRCLSVQRRWPPGQAAGSASVRNAGPKDAPLTLEGLTALWMKPSTQTGHTRPNAHRLMASSQTRCSRGGPASQLSEQPPESVSRPLSHTGTTRPCALGQSASLPRHRGHAPFDTQLALEPCEARDADPTPLQIQA